jgi:hypothetical protein
MFYWKALNKLNEKKLLSIILSTPKKEDILQDGDQNFVLNV